jgi:hypothetical protein
MNFLDGVDGALGTHWLHAGETYMTSRQHRRQQWAEQRGKELLRTIKETAFLQAMLTLGTDAPLAQQIRQLGLDTWNLSDEVYRGGWNGEIVCWRRREGACVEWEQLFPNSGRVPMGTRSGVTTMVVNSGPRNVSNWRQILVLA